MSYACYTQYRVEAPAKEINRLIDGLNARRHQGEKHDLVVLSHVPELTEENVRAYKNGTSVLSFETETRRCPWNLKWSKAILAFAPHAYIYYYAEDFPDEIVQTNDVWQHYFQETLVVEAYLTEKAPADVRKRFSEYGEYRSREDQVGWYLYTDTRGLRKLVAPFVQTRRRYHHEIMQEFREFQRELVWDTGSFINIYHIDFVEDNLTRLSPCQRCKEVAELYEALDEKDREFWELFEERNKLERELYQLKKKISLSGNFTD